MQHRPTDRDRGLRRVSRLTRWLTAGAAAAVGVLSALVAQAVPGSSGTASTTSSGSAAPTQAAPAPTTTTTTVAPSVPDPNLQPAPAPAPTPRHHVATSGGT
jgi:hypothetical protein